MKVELRYATLPGVIGLCAVHYWFVVWDETGCHRWEVWQIKHAGGHSIGHVHRDLKGPDAGVGGGPMRVACAWTGEAAMAVQRALAGAARYPHRNRYLAWPGPNSNTFVAWVMRQAGVQHPLGWKALGKRYPCRA